MPKAYADIRDEIKVHNQRNECRNLTCEYKRKNCDKKSVIKCGNKLTKIEEEGKAQIIEGIKTKGGCFTRLINLVKLF